MMQKHVVGDKAVAALLAVGLAVSMGACGGNGAQGQPSGSRRSPRDLHHHVCELRR